MSAEKFISRRKSSYCLVFPNKSALDRKEINKIFSKFGRVQYIVEVGDECGHRFVKYAKLEEAEKAVKGLRDHPSIKLMIPQHRDNNNSDLEKNPNSVNTRLLKYSRSMSKGELTDNVSDDNISSKTSNTSDSQSIKYLLNSRSKIKDNSSKVSDTIIQKKFYTKKSDSEVDENDLTDHEIPYGSEDQDVPALVKVSNKRADKKKKVVLNASDFTPKFYTKKSDSEVDENDLTDHKIPYGSEDQDVPALVKVSNKIADKKKKVVLNASDVIVGNIHKDYSEAYLLHLFEKYEPLAITEIEIIPKTENRYCHVYFTKEDDAAAVTRTFDDYELSGKKLVILRPKTLTKL